MNKTTHFAEYLRSQIVSNKDSNDIGVTTFIENLRSKYELFKYNVIGHEYQLEDDEEQCINDIKQSILEKLVTQLNHFDNVLFVREIIYDKQILPTDEFKRYIRIDIFFGEIK